MVFDSTRPWQDQLAYVAAFLRWWYQDALCSPERPLPGSGSQVPVALWRFHESHSGWVGRMHAYNELLTPSEMHVMDGKLVIAAEGGGAFVWACDRDEEHPKVYQRAGGEWVAEDERLCGFLMQFCMFEAISGAPTTCSRFDLPVGGLLESWKPVSVGPWRFPRYPSRFYQRDESLALVHAPEGASFLQCGGRKPGALDFMNPYISKAPAEWSMVRL